MAQTTSFDAFALWKEMYDKTENAWRDVIQETLGKEHFAENLGQIQSQYLQYQELVNKMSEAYLKQVNMPSREEVSNIATLIINVESKVDEIEDQVSELNESTSKEIEQLKKNVSALDKKLDKILALLSETEIKTSTKSTPATPKAPSADSTAKK